jgi:hypothetical protein
MPSSGAGCRSAVVPTGNDIAEVLLNFTLPSSVMLIVTAPAVPLIHVSSKNPKVDPKNTLPVPFGLSSKFAFVTAELISLLSSIVSSISTLLKILALALIVPTVTEFAVNERKFCVGSASTLV